MARNCESELYRDKAGEQRFCRGLRPERESRSWDRGCPPVRPQAVIQDLTHA